MSFLEIYFFLNVIFAVGALTSVLVIKLLKFFINRLEAGQVLKLHYFVVLSVLLSAFVLKLSPEEKSFEFPVSQTFSSALSETKESFAEVTQTSLPIVEQSLGLDLGFLLKTSILVVILFNLIQLWKGAVYTKNYVETGFLYKKIGKLSVFLSEKSVTPYAFSYFGRSYVSLPISLLSDAKNFAISSKHEIQHIRSKDTVFTYLGSVLKAVFFFNPAVLYWIKSINLEQEFSCDEKVISKRGVSEQDYKNCLFEVAKLGMSCERNLVGATGFFFGSTRSELIRRIQMMSTEKNKINKVALALVFATTLSLVSISAYAFSKHAGFGKLNAAEVQKMVDQNTFSEGFKIDVNQEVLKQLNRLTRTAKGKKQTAWVLKNFEKYKKVIHEAAHKHGLPEEIAAVAFVESGFTNPGKTRSYGEGMWQFIYPTAEAYGLVVNGKDLRRDVPAATDAAMKYLSSLNMIFADLRLAILSYNAGESAVAKRITHVRSRDPWAITKSGLKYDKGYLAKVMAAAIVMKNPEMIK